MVEKIIRDNLLYAIILPNEFQKDGLHFLSDDNDPQQLGYMQHPKGKVLLPHLHNPTPREITYTFEVLFIKRGKVRIDFFTEEKEYINSRILVTGDTILLGRGGHGFEMLEESEIVEVKQGPYPGDKDKVKFEPVTPEAIVVKDVNRHGSTSQ